MELKEAVAARRSIRAFGPEPVFRRILEEIMERALWAPSWGNTQPWKFTIVGGRTLELIREEFVQLAQRGVPSNPDITMPSQWSEIQIARYKGLGRELFQALGIKREDREKRDAYHMEMTRFFDAPNVIYLHLDQGFHPYALMDGGTILQTIALLAVDKGLGTCFLFRSISYPDVVRKHADIPSDQTLVMGLGIGYPLEDHPANRFRSRRGEPEEFFRWVDVE